jgi:hypothetical protein
MSQRLNRSNTDRTASSSFVENLESRALLSTVKNIPGLLIRNPDVWPGADRMVFNKITHKDAIRPNVTHDVGDIQLINTTSHTIVLDKVVIVNHLNYKMVRGGGLNISLAPHETRTVTLRFSGVGTGSELVAAMGSNLRITSGGRTDSVAMAGLWQAYSEQTTTQPHTYGEPSLQQLMNTVFGFKTSIATAAQEQSKGLLVSLGNHGSRTPVGSEVMGGYWTAANSATPVTVQMIAAWHRQNNFDPNTGAPTTAAATVRYYYQGASGSTMTNLFTHNINEGQSVVPHMSNSTTAMAMNSFTPTAGKSFGFKVDTRYSDDNLNPLDFNPSNNQKYPDTGHAIRFFPLKNVHGSAVANTYIMAMDYTALSYSNYDYQDNIYIVSNIKPASTGSSAAARPAAVVASATTSAFSATPVRDDMASVLGEGDATVLL